MREINALTIVGQRNPQLQLPIQILQFIDSLIRTWIAKNAYLDRHELPRFWIPMNNLSTGRRFAIRYNYNDVKTRSGKFYLPFTGMDHRLRRIYPYYGPGF